MIVAAVFSLACLSAHAQEPVEFASVRNLTDRAAWGVLSVDAKWALVARHPPRRSPTFTYSVFETATRKEVASFECGLITHHAMHSFVRPECISPDGKRAILPTSVKDHPKDTWAGARLLIFEAGKEPIAIESKRPSAWYGAWSLDGSEVYFIEGGSLAEPGYAIRRLNLAKGTYETLYENKTRLAFDLRRSPDGKSLAFHDFPGKEDEVRVVVLSVEDRKAVESEPFRLDGVAEKGLGTMFWDSKDVVCTRSPPVARDPGDPKRFEPWVFDPAARRSRPLFDAMPPYFVLGSLDAGYYASSQNSFFAVTPAGKARKLPGRLAIHSAAKGLWLVKDPQEGIMSLAEPIWHK